MAAKQQTIEEFLDEIEAELGDLMDDSEEMGKEAQIKEAFLEMEHRMLISRMYRDR